MSNPAHLAAQSRPAGALDDLRARVLEESCNQRVWTPEDGAMPALFVSHGAPPTLDDPEWLGDLYDWSASLPKPRAVVIVSAHWENAPVAISGAAAGTPLVYDFGGFHPHYYTLQYATPDATDLARRLAGVLGGITPIHHHVDRGLDHGAFIPMMAMYPAADVPVVQLSMPSLEPQALHRLGQKLRALRDEGILVIGSGFMTHSFAVMRDPSLAGHTEAFDEWAADALDRGDVDALTDYLAKGPGARVSHPTADHFVPLLLRHQAGTMLREQRVALARAFVARPRILFADEPTGSLDQATGAQISDLLFALNATSDTTLVLVTHDMSLAQRCRHIYRIDSGRLHAQTGPAA